MGRAAVIVASLAALLGIAAVPASAQYRIPADNPFAATPGAVPTIFASGLRNPWRFSFDRATGDLIVGDVAYDTQEEVTFVPFAGAFGGNFGWNCIEGNTPFAGCTPDRHVPPALVYPRTAGGAVTGGYVVRDPALGPWVGRYLFSDVKDGVVRWTNISQGSASPDPPASTGVSLPYLATFGEDGIGRLYIASFTNGRVERLTQSGGALGSTLIGTFTTPTFVTSPPGDAGRVFVTERAGQIRVHAGGAVETFLDISAQTSTDHAERGLFSMAFAPDYAESGRFFVVFTDTGGDVRVDEFLRSPSNPNRANAASQRQIFHAEHSSDGMHNGGQLQFGPDGRLYISIGDGGPHGDPNGNAQSLASPLGKIHRIEPLPRGPDSARGEADGRTVTDSRAPRLRVRVARLQRILRTKSVIAYARTTEVGRLRATGRLTVGHSSKRYRLTGVRRTAIPGRRYKLRLALTKRQLRIAARALRAERRVRVSLRITAADQAGNVRTSRRTVTARR